MPFEREYDPDELVDLLREHDGLTTRELADRMEETYQTTHSRCVTLEEEGRVTHLIFRNGHRIVWYAAE